MSVLETVPNLEVTTEQIEAFCRKWGIRELAVFGSVLRDDFTSESDIDVLFLPEPHVKITLSYLTMAQAELQTLFGREVDFIDKRQVLQDPNYLRRRIVLNSAQVIYAA